MKGFLAVLVLVAATACDGESGPADLVKGRDVCASCRMPVSDPRFAARITAPGELPQFFDEAGCLADFVKAASSKPSGAVAWVADHRTLAWVRADRAIYTRVPTLATPMNHHLIAHESAASRDSDPEAHGGQPVALQEMFGLAGPPSGASVP